MRIQITKPFVIKISVVLVLLFGLIWLANHSLVVVEVKEAVESEDMTYSFWDQNRSKEGRVSTRKLSVMRIVRRGTHEVAVTQNNSNYFGVVKAGGFLTKKTVHAQLVPESSRTFIGNNPLPCMIDAGQTLASWQCQDTADKLVTHVPATEATPTFIQRADALAESTVTSSFYSKSVPYALINVLGEGDEDHGAHNTYLAQPFKSDGNLSIDDGVVLSGLDPESNYGAISYKEGALVFNTSGKEAQYYRDVRQPPEKLELPQPTDPDQRLYSLDAKENTIVVVFNDGHLNDLSGNTFITHELAQSEEIEEGVANEEIISEIIVADKAGASMVRLEVKSLLQAKLCGKSFLCILHSNDTLDIYSLNNSKARLETSVTRVRQIERLNDHVLIARQDGVIRLDLESFTGSYTARLEPYNYCGLRQTNTGYLVCVETSRLGRAVLRVLADKPLTSEPADKKLVPLLQLLEVKSLSVYGNTVYITPEVGEFEVDPVSGSTGYNPESVKAARDALGAHITKLQQGSNPLKVFLTIQ